MNPITTPLVLLYLALPMTALVLNAVLCKKRLRPWLLFLLLWVTGYLIVNGAALIVDFQVTQKLESYDLNHNGNFEASEHTPAMRQAMLDFISDTGRRLAPITQIPVAFIYVSLNFVLFYFFRWLIRLFRNRGPKVGL